MGLYSPVGGGFTLLLHSVEELLSLNADIPDTPPAVTKAEMISNRLYFYKIIGNHWINVATGWSVRHSLP